MFGIERPQSERGNMSWSLTRYAPAGFVIMSAFGASVKRVWSEEFAGIMGVIAIMSLLQLAGLIRTKEHRLLAVSSCILSLTLMSLATSLPGKEMFWLGAAVGAILVGDASSLSTATEPQ